MPDPSPNLFSYQGKKVVLTGGASGVGAAAVELLAAAGCTDLTVLDRNEPTGPATAMNGHNMVADHGFSAWFTTGQVNLSGLA